LPKHVLIVEDQGTTRAMIRSAVEAIEGVTTVEASTGFEALKLLPRYRFDLIITDINMPDINGLELIGFVKGDARYREIPLIIVSTEATEEDRRRGMSLGASAYLVKPFQPSELQEAAKRLLADRP